MDRREVRNCCRCNQCVIKTNDSKVFRYPNSLCRSTLKYLGCDDIGGRKNPINRIALPRFLQETLNARKIVYLIVFLPGRADLLTSHTAFLCRQKCATGSVICGHLPIASTGQDYKVSLSYLNQMFSLQRSSHQVITLNAGRCRAKKPLDCNNRKIHISKGIFLLQIRAEENDPCHTVSSALLDIF